MRLWHQKLIPSLPRQQLLGQHRECCALRGRGWGRPHQTVNYVFNYSPYKLFQYHQLIMQEMHNRGYQPDNQWLNPNYRGKTELPYPNLASELLSTPIYPEHDDEYLTECIDNLRSKGIKLEL